nr:MAG TPA: hypothetical protein [Caudoviricetes sp.]
MNENIKDILKLINEHPDLLVIPMVGQDIVLDDMGDWVASFGKAEIRKICIYEETVSFYDEDPLKTAQTLDFYRFDPEIWDSVSGEKTNGITKEMIDSLDWLEVIIVHIETPTVNIPDNTEKINELLEG